MLLARLLMGAIATSAILVGSTAAAQPPATDIRVKIRIPPDLDRAHPDLRAAVETGGAGVIAEPAEFEIRSDRYLPDFTEMQPLVASSNLFLNDSVIRIGKMSAGEVPKVLAGVLGLMQRQKALEILVKRPPDGITFCKANIDDGGSCMAPEMAAFSGEFASSLIRNRGDRPRHVALLQTSADLAIHVIPLNAANATVARIEPGKVLSVPPLQLAGRGRLREFLVVSDQPFDANAFAQPSPFATKPECYGSLYADCIAPVTPIDTNRGWAAIGFTSFSSDEPGPAMGGGVNAARGDADWMVSLYSTVAYAPEEIAKDKLLPPDERKYLAERTPEERAHSCGGTMIAPDLVVTAAHCVATGRFARPNEARLFSDRRVRIGSLRLGRGGETRAVVGVAIHAGYTGEKSGIPNDVALLLLKRDDRIHLAPRALPVATSPAKVGSTVTGLGWGYTQSVAPGTNIMMSQDSELQRNPQILQQAPLEVLSPVTCARRLPGRIKAGMTCLVTPVEVARSGGAQTFSCRGDSGGPLVRDYGSGSEELVGMASWSRGCGYRDTPSVYSDAAYFAQWIALASKRIKAGQVVRVEQPARAR
jgi:secreted trypsin-like serine protease